MIPEGARQKQDRQQGSRPAQSGTQQTSLVDVEEHVRAFVTRQPVAAALIAVGVGYVVGRIASRR